MQSIIGRSRCNVRDGRDGSSSSSTTTRWTVPLVRAMAAASISEYASHVLCTERMPVSAGAMTGPTHQGSGCPVKSSKPPGEPTAPHDAKRRTLKRISWTKSRYHEQGK